MDYYCQHNNRPLPFKVFKKRKYECLESRCSIHLSIEQLLDLQFQWQVERFVLECLQHYLATRAQCC